MQIQGHSKGYVAEVTNEHQVKVQSESHELQHHNAWVEEQTYQVIGTSDVDNATNTTLHIKNTDSTRKLVVSFIRLQILDYSGGTALPAATTYAQLGINETVASGGSAVTPVNTHAGSGNTADVTATDSIPTMGGTFAELDRYYFTGDGDSVSYSKQGSIILDLNDTFSVRIVSDHTAGTMYARITFMMIDNDRA